MVELRIVNSFRTIARSQADRELCPSFAARRSAFSFSAVVSRVKTCSSSRLPSGTRCVVAMAVRIVVDERLRKRYRYRALMLTLEKHAEATGTVKQGAISADVDDPRALWYFALHLAFKRVSAATGSERVRTRAEMLAAYMLARSGPYAVDGSAAQKWAVSQFPARSRAFSDIELADMRAAKAYDLDPAT
jgi:hypothetical protein